MCKRMLLTQEQISQPGVLLSILQQHSKDLQDILSTLAPRLAILALRLAILALRLDTHTHQLVIQVLAQWAFLSNNSQCIISQVDLHRYCGCQYHCLHQTAHPGWNI